MNNLKTKSSLPEEMYLSKDFQGPDSHNGAREVFRNNTTAVEVIVKQVSNKNKNNKPFHGITNDKNVHKLNVDIEMLKNELDKTNNNLEETKFFFKIVLCEIKKQLEVANQRELKTQTKNVLLQLEKEKLKTLLDSKSNLVVKLKKELLRMRRALKFVITGIQCSPKLLDESDEYAEFEKQLKKSASLKNTKAFDLDCITFDSMFSSKIV